MKTITNDRLIQLDSLRGIAAILVVFFHIPSWNSTFHDSLFIRNSYLLVDFFFVLSGFVISRKYANFENKESIIKFQYLRFSRLYPIHFFILLLFLTIEFFKFYLMKGGTIQDFNSTPFSHNSLSALKEQLLLLQAIAWNNNALTFNTAAWSISVEFYTYIIYSIIVFKFHKLRVYIFSLIVLFSFYLLAIGIDIQKSYLLRCFSGFFIGCLVEKCPKAKFLTCKSWDFLSIYLIVYFAFISFADFEFKNVLIYILSAVLVYIGGICSSSNDVLKLKIFVWLGDRSYSIYMTHILVIYFTEQFLKRALGFNEIFYENEFSVRMSFIDCVYATTAVLLITIIISDFCYRKIEVPFRNYSRVLISKE